MTTSAASDHSGAKTQQRACRPATTDDEPSAPKTKPPGNAELLTDMDVAACAGLLPDPDAVAPHWMDASWAQDIREIQVRPAAIQLLLPAVASLLQSC